MNTLPTSVKTAKPATHVAQQLVSKELTKDSMIDVLDHNGGVLTLYGTAPTHAARLAAEMLAYATPGVHSVIVDVSVRR